MGVRIRGLREFQRALQKADRNVAAKLRRDLRELAMEVAREARSLAAQRTTRRTGDLERGIRPFARQGAVGVASTAEHGGYQYPRRLEFEGRGSTGYGPRASLYPAADEAAPELEAKAMGVLDETTRILGGGIPL